MAETSLLTELKDFKASLDARHADLAGKADRLMIRMDMLESEMNNPLGSSGGGRQAKSLSDAIFPTDEYKTFARRPVRGRVAFQLEKSFFENEFKTAILSSDQDSGALRAQRSPAIVAPGVEAFRVRNLIPRYPCTATAVDYLKEDVFTNAASPQVEGSAKGESALSFNLETLPVRTLAHWIPASRQVLDDLPQLRGYIDMRLMDGLKDEEDSQLLAGDGIGQNLSGLITNSTSYDSGLNDTGDTRIDKLNNAMVQIEAAKLRPTGIVLNPRDWRRIQKQKENNPSAGLGAYTMPGGPSGTSAPYLWGVPVATTTAMTAGTFLVGDFRLVALFDRMDAVIDISTEHADFFSRNLIAIRAEERLVLVVFRDDALIYGAF